MSPLELDTWYKRVPASENAALSLEGTFQTYVSPGKSNPDEMPGKELILGQPLPDELARAVVAHLEANKGTLKEIHAAAQLPFSRYSIDLSRGFATLLPHLAHLKSLNQLMRWEAIQQSAHGNRTEAVRALQSSLAIATSLEQEPVIVSSMVRIALLSAWLRALERVVTEQTLTDLELADLANRLSRTEEASRQAMIRGLVGERAIGLAAFDLDYQSFEGLSGMNGSSSAIFELPGLVKTGLYELRRTLGFKDRDLMFYLNRLGELESALKNDYPAMLRDAQAVSDIVDRAIPQHQIRYLVSAVVLPALSKALQKEAFLAAHLRCARAALAIEQFRLKNNGRLPSPNELVPAFILEWPRDPFTDQPLKYEKLPKGYRIVSGGAAEARKKENPNAKDTWASFTILR
jgi:hypothetical protein